jgi:glycerol-3-phosphate dehydrogenase
MQSYRFEAPPVVLSSWGGYIPLEWVKEGSTYSAARDDLLLDHSLSHQVMSVAAVKYSTFRRTAQRVVDRLSRAFGDRLSTSISHRIPLVGSETIGFEDFRNRFRELISSYADEVDAEYLYRTYGSSIEELSKLRSKSDIRSFFELEIAYLREYEFARLPDDILKRRLSIARTSDLDDRARSRLMDLF